MTRALVLLLCRVGLVGLVSLGSLQLVYAADDTNGFAWPEALGELEDVQIGMGLRELMLLRPAGDIPTGLIARAKTAEGETPEGVSQQLVEIFKRSELIDIAIYALRDDKLVGITVIGVLSHVVLETQRSALASSCIAKWGPGFERRVATIELPNVTYSAPMLLWQMGGIAAGLVVKPEFEDVRLASGVLLVRVIRQEDLKRDALLRGAATPDRIRDALFESIGLGGLIKRAIEGARPEQ